VFSESQPLPTDLPPGPVTCQPWCEFGDGHPAEGFSGDQVCYSPEVRTSLSLHAPIRCVGGRRDADYVGVLASARPREGPQVELAYREWPSVVLTADEARRLMAGLRYAIALCESARPASREPR
jgi:hypothetical protein